MNTLQKTAVVAACALALTACSDDDNNIVVPVPDDMMDMTDDMPAPEPVMVSFDLTVTNLTAGQPLSPVAVVAAESSWRAFRIGETASVALENLAEGGDNSMLLAAADAEAGIATASGDAPIGPGASATIRITLEEGEVANAYLNAVTMLVNTNDAITAVQGVKLSDITVDMPWSGRSISYDSGTEANSEAAGSIPGPAVSGEGFNAERDDRDVVFVHPGVVTADDGYSLSVLTAIHRWDNPVAQFTVTRVE